MTIPGISGWGRLSLAAFALAMAGGCSAGKEEVVDGTGRLLIGPRLEMLVVHVRVQPVFAVGDPDHLPRESRTLIVFLALPKGGKVTGKGPTRTEGSTVESQIVWDKGTITVACDFAKRGGAVNGQPLSLAGGNVWMVAVDEGGTPSIKGQYTDDTKQPTEDAGNPGRDLSREFLDLLRGKHPEIAEFIRENGGEFQPPQSTPKAIEK